MTKSYLLFLVIISSATTTFAQAPDTDIFWCDLQESQNQLTIGKPKNMTMRKGYDNQPYFINNEEMLYVAMDSTTKQSDIFLYGDKISRRAVTMTDSTSEFSPMLLADGKNVSAVLIEKDGKTQRIWHYPIQASTAESGQLWQNRIDNIGYYCPVSPDTMAVYILGDSPTLQIISKTDTIGHIAAGEIGRCLQRVPNSTDISFTQKTLNGKRYLKRLDLATFDVKSLTPTLPNSEDYVWLPSGKVLMGNDTGQLYVFDPKQPQKEWQLIVDWSSEAKHKITRLAISPNGKKLAVVME